MIYSDFKADFFNGKTNKRALLESLKQYSPDFKSLKKLVERFERENPQFKGLVAQVILGKQFSPKKYSEMNVERPLYNSFDLEKEMSWEAMAFVKSAHLINAFIALRDKFENNLLIGDYETAREILNKIESEICKSFWTVENRLILDEYQFGSEKNWETRNLLLDEENVPMVKITGDFYSVKTESKYSFFQFNDYFDGWEKMQSESEFGLPKDLRNYLRFKANYFSISRYDNYSDILHREHISSIIDRYIMFVRITQHLTIAYNNSYNFLFPILEILKAQINDISFTQILIVFGLGDNYQVDHDIINLIDIYTLGQYNLAKELAKNLIINLKGNHLEVYEIYSKSLIEAGIPYEQITENESLSNTISKIYYDVFSKNENVDNGIIDLIKLSYVFNNSHIGLHLYSLVNEQLDWKPEINYGFLRRLNSKFINPALYNYIYNNSKSSTDFLDRLALRFNESVTINLFQTFKKNYEGVEITPFLNVPYIKAKLYECRSLILKKQYFLAVENYDELLSLHLSQIAFYEVFSNLFSAHLNIGNYRNCVVIFVDAYLKNVHLIKSMDVNSLLDIIIIGKFKNVSVSENLIELPIFFQINSGEKIRVKQSYELFLKSNGCTKPTELLRFKSKFSLEKLIYFLRFVCIPDILQLSKFMESTYKVNEERIRICQELAVLDSLNIKLYNQEIAYITQKNAISKVIGRIDEGKIYVNDEKIKLTFIKPELKAEVTKINVPSSEGYLTKEYFYRTVDLQKFTEHKEYKQSPKVFYADYDSEGNLKFKNNPVYDSFRTMFLEVRDNFVSNNEFGLDSYLSTRIRHGTLPNHIRSVFERLYLVTAQTDGIYADNEFWEERLNMDDERTPKIQQLLADFSRQIDELSTILKEDLIQSKTEKRMEKPLALFDYIYKNDYDLLPLFISKVDNYEEFIDICFTELWNRTESCLETIKDKLNNEIKQKFISLITDLEQELEKLQFNNDLYELKNNVNLSRTEIQILLSNIVKWFKRSESSYDGEYELKMLAETSIQITKNINPIYNFDIETEISSNIAVRGEFHQDLIDIIRNFLENMIKRSKLPIENLNPFVSICEREELLIFCFKNNISEMIDQSELIRKLTYVKTHWGISDSNISKEDGTGFPKIKKILHYDLDRQASGFNFELNNNRLEIELCFESTGLKYENFNN